jgi:hypothetical protein
MASVIPKFLKKEIVDDWAAENLKLMLLSNVHAPNAATQHYISDVSANEIVDNGPAPKYVAGGVTLTVKTSNYDTNNAYLSANNPVIGPGCNLNYRYGIIYRDMGNPALSPIRAQIDFVTDQIVVNGTSLIQWDAALGIIHIA